MSFYIYDVIFLIVFSLFVITFLYKRRKNLKKEGIMYLYRTKVGLRFIEYVGTKYKKTLSVFAFLGIVCGYFLMIVMLWFLYRIVHLYLFMPDIVRAIKIPPLMPLIPYLPEAFNVSFLPPFYFTYWIISIAVIALFHEFAHGIIARRYNIRILTTGFGFLGPFLAAFVEPDEKEMEEKPKYQQLAVLSAGVFTNLILAILFFILLSLFFLITYVPAGAMFNTYTPGVVEISSISMVGGKLVSDLSNQGILDLIEENNLTDDLILGTNGNKINFTKIIANNKLYYTNIDNLKSQLNIEGREQVIIYEDLPAINVGLRGSIVKVNEYDIKDYEDLSAAMEGLRPAEKISITTNDEGEVLEYELALGMDPSNESRAILGIGLMKNDGRMLGMITDFFNFFKEDGTNYEPRFNADFVLFIYNLIWWLALINLSVALINMWPVAIFDGGRFFMLTVWAITGSEKLAMSLFKLMTYLILGSLLLLMFGYFNAIGWIF
jgi:membrane-associated protease RseP (regulator of RpoE activity)